MNAVSILPVPRIRLAATALALTLFAAALVPAFDGTGAPMGLALVGGIGLVGITLLAVGRYDAAVMLGFVLEGVVLVEPAPSDATFAVVMAVAVVTGRFRLARIPRHVLTLVALFMILNVLSIMFAISVPTALRFFFITAYLLVFAVWLTGYVDSPARARLLVRSWLVIAVASALIGILAFNLPLPGRTLFLGDDATRAKAFFKDPNVFGPFLIPIAVILLEERLRPRLLSMSRNLSGVLFIILALGVLFSFSRAAWANLLLATAVMLGVQMARRGGGRRAFRLVLTLAAAGVLAGAVLAATGQIGFLQQRAQVQSYDTQRFGSQHYGYELGWQYPVGVGPGQFTLHHDLATHSTFIRTLAEQGWGGLALWLGLVVSTLILAARQAIAGADTYGIGSAALLGSWCGLVFNSVVVDTLHWRYLWIVAALIWAGAMRERTAGRGRVALRA